MSYNSVFLFSFIETKRNEDAEIFPEREEILRDSSVSRVSGSRRIFVEKILTKFHGERTDVVLW